MISFMVVGIISTPWQRLLVMAVALRRLWKNENSMSSLNDVRFVATFEMFWLTWGGAEKLIWNINYVRIYYEKLNFNYLAFHGNSCRTNNEHKKKSLWAGSVLLAPQLECQSKWVWVALIDVNRIWCVEVLSWNIVVNYVGRQKMSWAKMLNSFFCLATTSHLRLGISYFTGKITIGLLHTKDHLDN